MKLENRIALIGLSLVFVGGFVYSQIHIHQKNRKDIQGIARELALSWQEKLGLTDDQTFMLENIIIEFTLRKNDIINSTNLQEKKIKKLKRVQEREHMRLKKFLSTTQFDAYLTLNKRIANPVLDI
ncbi:MAG: hypothetical protein WCD31_10950 [Gillisia sp.]